MKDEKCCVKGCNCEGTELHMVAVSVDVFRAIYTCDGHVGRIRQYDQDLAAAWLTATEPDNLQ